MDYQARCRSRSKCCHGSVVFWTAFSKCLCEDSLLFSCCRLRKLFHSSAGVLNSPRERGWKLGFTAEEYKLNPAQPQLLPALSSAAFQLRSFISACQMSRWNKGAAWVMTPLPPLPHISHRHVIPGVSGISPLVTTKTAMSALCTWLQEAEVREACSSSNSNGQRKELFFLSFISGAKVSVSPKTRVGRGGLKRPYQWSTEEQGNQ